MIWDCSILYELDLVYSMYVTVKSLRILIHVITLNRHIVPLGLDKHLPLDNAVLQLPPQQHLLLLQLVKDITILPSTSLNNDQSIS